MFTSFSKDLLLAAKNAKDNLNYKEIHGKPIRIMWANRNPSARKSKEGNIFIKVCTPTSLHSCRNPHGVTLRS